MFKILSKDNSPYGTDYYRSTDASIPAAYRATHTHKTDMNKSGTNSNVTINTKVPVVVNSDGRMFSTDAFKVSTYFSSLQHITAEEDRMSALHEHLKFYILGMNDVAAGTLPDEPYNTQVSLKSVLDALSATLV